MTGSAFYIRYRTRLLPEVVYAHLVEATQDVALLRGGKPVTVKAGMKLEPGDTLKTGEEGRITIGYPREETTIALEPETVMTLDAAGPAAGKRFYLEKGEMDAVVSPQPEKTPMTLETPHARMEVVGTHFGLVTASSTQLDVHEGQAKLTRTSDKMIALIPAGHYAVAGPGIDLVPLPFSTEGNLLINPGFENDGEEWNESNAVRRSIVSAQAHSGARALESRIASRGGAAGRKKAIGVTQIIPVTPGVRYRASGWMKSDEGVGKIRLNWLNAAGKPLLRQEVGIVSDSAVWKYMGRHVKAPKKAATVVFEILAQPARDNAGAVWTDDIYFGKE